jgi:hypothetical protein
LSDQREKWDWKEPTVALMWRRWASMSVVVALRWTMAAVPCSRALWGLVCVMRGGEVCDEMRVGKTDIDD